MKTLVCLLLLAPICLVGQRPPKVEGLGKFKPGSTTVDVIDELTKELNAKVVEQKAFLAEKDFEKGKIYKVVYDPSEANKPSRASKCAQSKVYRVGDYSFSGVNLKEAYLTFHNDVLVELEAKITPDILEAMPSRYGAPQSTIEEREVECSGPGKKEKFQEKFFIYTWKNDDIEAKSVIEPTYDDNCKRQFVRSFSVKTAKGYNAHADCGR
ncbi:hypothetical protein [Nibrella saemangeumensis]